MSLPPGHEPIDEDELIYRRVPVSKGWYSDSSLSPEAFDPRSDEVTGISVYRAKYKTLEDAAKGASRQGYYVAVLRAGDLRAHGIQIVPRPLAGDPGHAELPDLTCHNRNDDATLERKDWLATLPKCVKGPFGSS